MRLADRWSDYALLDATDGNRLERWGDILLIRPDPQVIWKPPAAHPGWKKAHARYLRSSSGGGRWERLRQVPEMWKINYPLAVDRQSADQPLTFALKPMGFKHTGLFPEQAVNWDWMRERIAGAKHPVRVLNLFGYTGGATCACLKEGAEVVHVDAAKGMIAWAKDNVAACGLEGASVRYIVDDCLKFVRREGRRGNRYDGILMDPPSYGRGPTGEMWRMEDSLYELVEACAALLSDTPVFCLINSYTTGLAPSVLANVLKLALPKGTVEADEVGLPIQRGNLVLPCGASGRWSVL